MYTNSLHKDLAQVALRLACQLGHDLRACMHAINTNRNRIPQTSTEALNMG
jgi:hypothetical protein